MGHLRFSMTAPIHTIAWLRAGNETGAHFAFNRSLLAACCKPAMRALCFQAILCPGLGRIPTGVFSGFLKFICPLLFPSFFFLYFLAVLCGSFPRFSNS